MFSTDQAILFHSSHNNLHCWKEEGYSYYAEVAPRNMGLAIKCFLLEMGDYDSQMVEM